MKLVVAHLGSLRTYVSREFYYVIIELMRSHGWRHIYTSDLSEDGGTLTEMIVSELGEMPEAVLFWESYELLEARADEVSGLECAKYIFADDLHWWDDWMRPNRLICFPLFDTILSTYAYAWDGLYPEFAGTKKLVWVPHAASPDFMLPYNPRPENSILMSGTISPTSPLRPTMKLLYERGSYAIAYYEHPGYQRTYDYEKDEAVGRGYAEKINRHRAAFTDGHRWNYVVAKYFEIPATGALLFAENAVGPQLRELGFVENENYLPVSKDDLEEKIQYILDERNHEEVDAIRRRGQKLVWERHTTADRARQIDEACSG
jgi:hypothetical protein